MAIESILAQIDAEIASLTKVRALLASTGEVTTGLVGSPTKKRKGTKKRQLSPEARKRIGDAQRKRWAAQKRAKAKAK